MHKAFRVLVLILVLLCAGQAWGATIYATNDLVNVGMVCFKSGSIPDASCTGGTSNSTLQAAATAAGAGGFLYLDGSATFTGAGIDSDNTITVSNGATIDRYGSGTPIIDGSTGTTAVILYASAGLCTIKNIKIQNRANGDAININAGTALIESCIFENNARDAPVFTGTSTGGIVRKCRFIGGAKNNSSSSGYVSSANAVLYIVYNIFESERGEMRPYYGTTYIYNNIFRNYANSHVIAVASNNSPTVVIANNIFDQVTKAGSFQITVSGTPTPNVTAANNFFFRLTTALTTAPVSGSVTDNGGNIGITTGAADGIPYPGWKRTEAYYNGSYVSTISLVFCDGISHADYSQWAGLLRSNGFNGVVKVITSETDAAEWALLQSEVNNGFEVALQGVRYLEMGKTGTGISIQYVGAAGSCSATVDTTAGTLTTSAGGSWTLSSYDTLTALVSAIDLDPNYTCSVVGTDAYAGSHFTLSLTDGTKSDIKTSAQTILVDRDKMHTLNILAAITETAANLTENGSPYVVKSFIHPGHEHQADTLTYLAAHGIAMNYDASGAENAWLDDGVDLMAVCRLPASTINTQQQIKMSSYIQTAEKRGGAMVHYMHNFSAGTDATEYQNILTLLKVVRTKTMTMRDAAAYLVGLSTGGTNRNPTFTLSETPNYELLPNSPAIDAGAPITGLHTSGSNLITGGDAAGNVFLYGNGIDIGAYEMWQGHDQQFFDFFGKVPHLYTVP